jgi:hypothetical protein
MKSVVGLEAIDGVLLDGLDFCKLAYDALELIQQESVGTSELRLLKSPRAKKLLEEVLPIAAFLQVRYGPGVRIRVRWRGGNQRYDARLLYSGAKVEASDVARIQHLEITTAVHANDHLAREHLHREGGSFGAHGTTRDPVTRRTISRPASRRHEDVEREIVALARKCIESKNRLPYPRNTTLVVRCVATTVVMPDEWDRAVAWLREAPHPARFDEVILVESFGNRVTSVSRKPTRNKRGNIRLQQVPAE